MPVQMKCQKRFLKPGHRNPFLRILLACGDNGIFTTLHVEQRQITFTLPSTTFTEERGTEISANQPLSTSDASESVAS